MLDALLVSIWTDIVSGDDAAPFEVRDSDMTLVYKGGSLEVKEHSFDLTVNGDAGMANRAIIGKVTVIVTASNQAPSAPAPFEENRKGRRERCRLIS